MTPSATAPDVSPVAPPTETGSRVCWLVSVSVRLRRVVRLCVLVGRRRMMGLILMLIVVRRRVRLVVLVLVRVRRRGLLLVRVSCRVV